MICKKCRYFRPFMGVGGQRGECRRYPPRWPVVGGGDWCGEFMVENRNMEE